MILSNYRLLEKIPVFTLCGVGNVTFFTYKGGR